MAAPRIKVARADVESAASTLSECKDLVSRLLAEAKMAKNKDDIASLSKLYDKISVSLVKLRPEECKKREKLAPDLDVEGLGESDDAKSIAALSISAPQHFLSSNANMLKSTLAIRRSSLLAPTEAKFLETKDIKYSDEGSLFVKRMQKFLSNVSHTPSSTRAIASPLESKEIKTIPVPVRQSSELSANPQQYVTRTLALPTEAWKKSIYSCTIWLPHEVDGVTLPITKTKVAFSKTQKVGQILGKVAEKCKRMMKAKAASMSSTSSETSSPSLDSKESKSEQVHWANDHRIALRVPGMQEYLTHETVVFDSKYVRQALRHSGKIEFILELLTTNNPLLASYSLQEHPNPILLSPTSQIDNANSPPPPLIPPPPIPGRFSDNKGHRRRVSKTPPPPVRHRNKHRHRRSSAISLNNKKTESVHSKPKLQAHRQSIEDLTSASPRRSRKSQMKDIYTTGFGKFNWHSGTWISIHDISTPFRLMIRGVDQNPRTVKKMLRSLESEKASDINQDIWMRVRTLLITGDQVLAHSSWKTPFVPFSLGPRWMYSLYPYHANIEPCRLPHYTRIAMFLSISKSLQGIEPSEAQLLAEEEVIAWVTIPLKTHNGSLVSGKQTYKLWPLEHHEEQATHEQEKKDAGKKKSKKDKHKQKKENIGSDMAHWLEHAFSPRHRARARTLSTKLNFLTFTPPYPNTDETSPALTVEFPEFILPVFWDTPVSSSSYRPPPPLPKAVREKLKLEEKNPLRRGSMPQSSHRVSLTYSTNPTAASAPNTPMHTTSPAAKRKNWEKERPTSDLGKFSKILLGKEFTERVQQLLLDPLHIVTSEERTYILKLKNELCLDERALPLMLKLLPWYKDTKTSQQALDILSIWTPPSQPLTILPLLMNRFACPLVRQYAVKCLEFLDDHDIISILPQLLICANGESYHWNPLVQFLLNRGKNSPMHFGFYLAWHLRASLSVANVRERSALMIGALLGQCPGLRFQLDCCMSVFNHVSSIALSIAIQRGQGVPENVLTEKLRQALQEVNEYIEKLPSKSIVLPYDPRVFVGKLIIRECKYLTSKKTPLWLTFAQPDTSADNKERSPLSRSGDGTSVLGPDDDSKSVRQAKKKSRIQANETCEKDKRPIRCIFKAGDDLRQDMLTIQALRFMDQIWLADGLDLKIVTYEAIATEGVLVSGGMGFIEVVEGSLTKGKIQRMFGGRTGAFKGNVILKYIESCHPRETDLKVALENYKRSLAGYCVASYVLGIGDRHSDNVMIRKDGCFLHIDFGNFLGNFKTKWGIRREREAFLLTPAMAYPMGGAKWKTSKVFDEFKDLCVKAYLSVRARAPKLLYLLEGMMPANMPQLRAPKDLRYVREKLNLNLASVDAEKSFRGEIQRSLGTFMRRLDDFIHDNVHYKK